MASFRFITDNPFRLLGIGTATSLRDLKQKAATVEVAAKVGMAAEPGLAKLFGSEELPHCVSLVRALTNDPVQITGYRLFWPFTLPATLHSFDTLETLEMAPADAAPFFSLQRTFLTCWYRFLTSDDTDMLRTALASFGELYNDTECDKYLQTLIETDGAEPDASIGFVYDAAKQGCTVLLGEACRAAAAAWERGDYTRCGAHLSAVINSGYTRDAVDVALIEATPVFDRAMLAIQKEAEAYGGWSPEADTFDPNTMQPLRQVADLLKSHVPSAGLWQDAIDSRVLQVASSMRDYAIDLANEKSDNQGCAEILGRIKTLPAPPEFLSRIDADLSALAGLDEQKAIWEEITPIKSTPSLTTINGVGFKLYGREPFPAKPEWHFVTQYAVFLYIPIVPLARYLVSDAPSGGWYFHGKSKFTKGNKIHLGVSLGLIGFFAIFCTIMSSMPNSASNFRSGADPEAGSSSSAQAVTTDQSRISRLDAEYDKLKPELEAEDAALTQEKQRLDQLEQSLGIKASTVHKGDHTDLADFGKRMEQFKKDTKAFDQRTKEYNVKVNRINQIINALKEMGE